LNPRPPACAVPLEPQPPAFFALGYFSHRVLRFCPGLASNHDPPTYASFVAGVTDYRCVPPQPVCSVKMEGEVSLTFSLGLVSTWIFLISTF
jgi:hypothetical protein